MTRTYQTLREVASVIVLALVIFSPGAIALVANR